MQTCDKNRRPIMVGDVLKVFHFVGARRKRHYMYKQVVGERSLGGYAGTEKVPHFDVSHLDLSGSGNYKIGKEQGVLEDYEILQGLDDIEGRAKL